MARQLTCQLWSYVCAVQPFLIDVPAASPAGGASMIPQRPPPVVRCWSATPPRTLRIVVSSHGVHCGPAAVPLATQTPSPAASAGGMLVYDHSLRPDGLECGSRQSEISSRTEESPPLRS